MSWNKLYKGGREMEREIELKKQLLEFKNNDWNIPDGIDNYQLALEAMDNIGSIDGELRDDLILTYLWILITEKILSKEQIKELLDISLSDKHLFFRLREKQDDSVFNRAFTILIIRWIIYYHNNYGEDLFTEKEIHKIFENVIKYVREEKDLRGYVEGRGWAHAMGHSGDALRTFALCNYITHNQLLDMLEVIKEKVAIFIFNNRFSN